MSKVAANAAPVTAMVASAVMAAATAAITPWKAKHLLKTVMSLERHTMHRKT